MKIHEREKKKKYVQCALHTLEGFRLVFTYIHAYIYAHIYTYIVKVVTSLFITNLFETLSSLSFLFLFLKLIPTSPWCVHTYIYIYVYIRTCIPYECHDPAYLYVFMAKIIPSIRLPSPQNNIKLAQYKYTPQKHSPLFHLLPVCTWYKLPLAERTAMHLAIRNRKTKGKPLNEKSTNEKGKRMLRKEEKT